MSVENDAIGQRALWVHKLPRPAGRPRAFKNPDQLWNKFLEYIDDVEANPWQVKSASNSIGSKGREKINQTNSMRQDVRVLRRAYTLVGFCAFAGIHTKWGNFRNNYITKSRGFKQTVIAIENVVEMQQVDGAMLNIFNSNLVARLNGIADVQVNEITGKGGELLRFPRISMSDIEQLKKINGL